MALILAIEPDRNQANQLTAMARGRLHADLVIEATAERAFAELGDRVPDLILTAALLSPRDEAALGERLRALESAAAHVHTLTIPVLAAPRSRPRVGGMLSALRRDRASSELDGCDPAVFAEQCATYLERAMAERREAAAADAHVETDHPAEGYAEEAVEVPAVAGSVTGDAFEPPLEEFVVEEAVVEEAVVEEAVDIPAVANPVEEMAAPIEHPVASVDEPIEAVERPLATVEEPITEEALAPFPPAAHDQVPAFETVPDEPLADPAASEPIVEDIVEAPQLAASAGSLEPVFDESPLFELVSEAESDRAVERSEDDLERYIELDLSEFLDQSAPVLHAVALSGVDSSAAPSVESTNRPARPSPLEVKRAAADQPALKPETTGEPDDGDWLDVVEALRRDVERLDTAPAASTRPAKPVRKHPAPRKTVKGKPVQDEWGFFDPEQCGFAALLAKLEEVTRSDDPLKRKRA